MAKIVVNEDNFIKKCNEELIKHLAYEVGMEFIRLPKENPNAGAFSWNGPNHKTAVFAEVARKVEVQYEIRATQINRR